MGRDALRKCCIGGADWAVVKAVMGDVMGDVGNYCNLCFCSSQMKRVIIGDVGSKTLYRSD
jgi:hypothetical protein